jgi:hypothetical protein
LVLVGPSGAALVLVGGCGGSWSASFLNLRFLDAAVSLPPGSPLITGSFKPIQCARLGSFPAPGPGLAYLSPAPVGTWTLTTQFVGTKPNGLWSLYAFDPVSGDSGQIAGGWSLEIDATPRPVPALPRGGVWVLAALLGLTALAPRITRVARPDGTASRSHR